MGSHLRRHHHQKPTPYLQRLPRQTQNRRRVLLEPQHQKNRRLNPRLRPHRPTQKQPRPDPPIQTLQKTLTHVLDTRNGQGPCLRHNHRPQHLLILRPRTPHHPLPRHGMDPPRKTRPLHAPRLPRHHLKTKPRRNPQRLPKIPQQTTPSTTEMKPSSVGPTGN